jgi:hypothetical protein
MFLVIPLVLTKFSEVEIAAWLLFSSILMFGDIFISRLGITFLRMIALAMGGASDLSPIKPGDPPRGDGKPNWEAVGRTFGTLFWVQILAGIACGALAFGLGVFALPNLIAQGGDAREIWTAFFVAVGSSTVVYAFRSYNTFLLGTNLVALENRWGAVFNILSVIVGVTVMVFLPGLLALVIAMQSMVLLGVLRARWLARRSFDGLLKQNQTKNWDATVLQSAWTPLWRGFVLQCSDTGVIQLSSIIYARFGQVDSVAAFLFTLKIAQIIESFSLVPFSSRSPMYSSLLSSGKLMELKKLVLARINISFVFLSCGYMALLLFGAKALAEFGANATLVSLPLLCLIWFSTTTRWHLNLLWSISLSGNHISLLKENVITVFIATTAAALLIPKYGALAAIISSALPRVLILNLKPCQISAQLLGVDSRDLFYSTLWPLLLPCIAFFIALLIR